MVCNAGGGHLEAYGEDCLIVSVGSNGDASFEETMRSFNPSCAVHIYDPSLSAEQIANVPSWATFSTSPLMPARPRGGTRAVASRCSRLIVRDAEFEALPAWLEATACTDLIIPEVRLLEPASGGECEGAHAALPRPDVDGRARGL